MIRKLIALLFHRGRVNWAERHYVLLIIVGVIVAMGISLAIGIRQSVWFDEAYSIMLAKQSIAQLLYLTAVDTHPPFYYLLLKGWAAMFGWSELALRSFSVIAMGGAVALGTLLVKRMFTTRVALITLPFIVFAPFLLRYGFEIRMYALASLIAIAATYVLVTALQTKQQKKQRMLYILYAVLVALGVYTLYYTVLLWLAHLLWLVWAARKDHQPIVRSPWLVALGGSVLLFAPWLPTFISQISNGALAAISQPLTIGNMIGIISFMFVYQPSWQLTALTSLLILFVIITLVILGNRAWTLANVKQRAYMLLLGMYILVPVTVLTLISLVRPMYVERYLAHVLIAVSLFTGVMVALVLAKKPSKKVMIACSGLLVVMFVGVNQLAYVGNYNFQRLQTPTINKASAAIGDCKSDKTILAADPYVAIELSYYLPDCEIHFYSEWASMGGGYAPLSGSRLRVADPARELINSKQIVYVYYDDSKLLMPESHTQSTHQTFDTLHVVKLSKK